METIASAKGTVRLAPIEGSIDEETIEHEIELLRADGVLILGDLRRAAESATDQRAHEVAHRLWSFVREAARRAGDNSLVVRAVRQGDLAIVEARAASGQLSKDAPRRRSSDRSVERRRRSSYDYRSLAADVAEGMAKSAVAHKWGCSTGTVSRAASYVEQCDALLEAHPEVRAEIERGDDVNDLAERHGLPTKVMKWIVSDYWDRRT